MNKQQLKALLLLLDLSYTDFCQYMVGKTIQDDFFYLSDIEYFLYLKIKSKLNL